MTDAGPLCPILVFHSQHHRKLSSLLCLLCQPTYKVTRVINNSLHIGQECSRCQRTLAFHCVFWKCEVGKRFRLKNRGGGTAFPRVPPYFNHWLSLLLSLPEENVTDLSDENAEGKAEFESDSSGDVIDENEQSDKSIATSDCCVFDGVEKYEAKHDDVVLPERKQLMTLVNNTSKILYISFVILPFYHIAVHIALSSK